MALNLLEFTRYTANRAACLMLILPALSVMGQEDSSIYVLPGATIRDARFDRTGFAVWKADSLPLEGAVSLSERLLWENPVATRINGPGLLATVSARGAGPSRSPVFWNGINLQSPQNGVMDASLLPLWPGDRLEVRYGGQSAIRSSGAMGGAVLVEPDYSVEKIFSGSLSLAAGSFGRREAQAQLGISQGMFASKTRLGWQQADNDFPFKNTARIGSPDVRQVNNRLEKLDLQQFNRWVNTDKNQVKTAVWHQRVFREIPPAMTAAEVETWQRDRSTRAVVTWEHAPGTHTLWQMRGAYIDEAILFRYAGDVDSSRARTALLNLEYSSMAGRRLSWKAGGFGARQWAAADGYSDTSRWFGQTRLAGFAMAEWQWRNGRLTALARQEYTENLAAPFTWSMGGEVALGEAGGVRFHFSRNFNLPTFNDRFWKEYGKPDLRPEKGYSADAGWMFRKKSFSMEVTVFQLLLDDWILWQPDANGIFKPDNLRKVSSRGGSFSGHWQWNSGHWRCRFSGLYQYVNATNVAVYDQFESALHKQILYTPNHSGGCTVRVEKGGFSGAYLHQWTGGQFITTDNSLALRAYNLGNLLLRYSFQNNADQPMEKKQRKHLEISLDIRLENVWNRPCQTIANRPMPGRNGRLGLTLAW